MLKTKAGNDGIVAFIALLGYVREFGDAHGSLKFSGTEDETTLLEKEVCGWTGTHGKFLKSATEAGLVRRELGHLTVSNWVDQYGAHAQSDEYYSARALYANICKDTLKKDSPEALKAKEYMDACSRSVGERVLNAKKSKTRSKPHTQVTLYTQDTQHTLDKDAPGQTVFDDLLLEGPSKAPNNEPPVPAVLKPNPETRRPLPAAPASASPRGCASIAEIIGALKPAAKNNGDNLQNGKSNGNGDKFNSPKWQQIWYFLSQHYYVERERDIALRFLASWYGGREPDIDAPLFRHLARMTIAKFKESNNELTVNLWAYLNSKRISEASDTAQHAAKTEFLHIVNTWNGVTPE